MSRSDGAGAAARTNAAAGGSCPRNPDSSRGFGGKNDGHGEGANGGTDAEAEAGRVAEGVTIERLTGDGAGAVVEPLLREYVPWVAEQLADIGVTFDDTDAMVEQHHALFREELPNILGRRGRLLAARLADGEVVGVGALRPIDAMTAEIKRMYVRLSGRGRGIGRALLERLLADARSEGFGVVRLETAHFMTAAVALYRSLGFHDVEMFDGSETAVSGLEALTHYLEVDLSWPEGIRGRREGDR